MTDDRSGLTLRDLGEGRIVRELIIPRFPQVSGTIVGIGDDCAVIPTVPPNHPLVLTTDPCPTPIVCIVEAPDFYHYGRLTALINVSDLAAMGAHPLGLLVATVMPEDMRVREYERFLDGLADACHEWSCPVIGGNIKDGPTFTANGSALGFVKADCLMRRTGAAPGDRVCVVGEMGLLWAAVLTRLFPRPNLDTFEQRALDAALYKPVARLAEGIALGEARKTTACMDSSDGVIGCLRELALVNRADIVVNGAALVAHPAVSRVAQCCDIDPRILMLSWGNWELVCTTPPSNVSEIKLLVESLGAPFTEIGEVRPGTGRVWLEEHGRLAALRNFASERFRATSIFTHGLDAYMHLLRTEPLVDTGDFESG